MEPVAAATVIVVRDATSGFEVYLLRRSAASAFVPDMFVFPGGRVDAADRAAAGSDDEAYRYAAVRETFEEAGLLFATRPVAPHQLDSARAGLSAGTHTFAEALHRLETAVDTTALHYFSRWITPPGEVRRFDTRFFVARAPAGQVAGADAYETLDGRWVTPSEALRAHAAGALAMIFPTVKHLERVAGFATIDDLVAFARTKAIVTVMPEIRDGRRFALPEALEGAW